MTLFSSSQVHAGWELSVLDGTTHERRYFSPPGDVDYKIPVNFGPWECILPKQTLERETFKNIPAIYLAREITCEAKNKSLKVGTISMATNYPQNASLNDKGRVVLQLFWDHKNKAYGKMLTLEYK